MIRVVVESGYKGPIGILDHREHLDARESLLENRDGLEWVRKEIEKPGSGGPKPLAAAVSASVPLATGTGRIYDGNDAYRRPPITVEMQATIRRTDQYNILVASDTKASADHWEIFSMNGSGKLTAHLPGKRPDHVHTESMICDGKPHNISMKYEPARVRLYVDGTQVADQAIANPDIGSSIPGGIAIGQLVEGVFGFAGMIDWVRISKGLREIPTKPVTTVSRDDSTIGLWQFNRADQHRAEQHRAEQHQAE